MKRKKKLSTNPQCKNVGNVAAETNPARIFRKKEKNDLYFCIGNGIIINKEKDLAKPRERLMRKRRNFYG